MNNAVNNSTNNPMDNDLNEIIRVDNVSFKYEKDYIINNLSFTINKGEYVGITGANGTGKSTLMKLLLGQLEPTEGEILLFGSKIGPSSLSKIGYVPQVGMSRGYDFPATVEEIVTGNLFKEIGLMRFPKKKHREKVRNTLALVGMEDFMKRKISDLSGGQQQRVIIARALVSSPEVLFLDEPTTAIDFKSENMLYKLLDTLNKKLNITIVMVTHDLVRIDEQASRIISLDTMFEDEQVEDYEISADVIQGYNRLKEERK